MHTKIDPSGAERVGRSESETTPDTKAILANILRQSALTVPYDTACVMLVVGTEAQVVLAEGYGALADDLGEDVPDQLIGRRLSLASTRNLNRIVTEKRPHIIDDVHNYADWIDIPTAKHIRSWVGVPVLIDGELAAIFSLDKMEPGFYQPVHVERLLTFADQAAIALKNERLFGAAQRQLDELTALHAIVAAGTESESVDELITRATDIIGKTLFPDNFGFMLVDFESQTLIAHASYRTSDGPDDQQIIPFSRGVTGEVAATGKPIRINDTRLAANYIPAAAGTLSELCVPIVIREVIYGIINAECSRLNAFTTADERLLVTIANQLATAIERMHLFEEERWRRTAAETLSEATSALLSSIELVDILETILSNLEQVVAFDSASILLLDDVELRVVAARGFAGETIVGFGFPADKPLFKKMQATRQPVFLPDVRKDPRFLKLGPFEYIRSWIGAPLIARGEVIGELTIDHKLPEYYTAKDIRLAQSFANHAALAINNARNYEAAQLARFNAETLVQANQTLGSVLDQDTILTTLMDALMRLIPHSGSTILLRRDDEAFVHETHGYAEPSPSAETRFDLQRDKILGPVFLEKQSLLIKDVRATDEWEDRAATSSVRSWLGVPLIANGEVIACFSIENNVPYGLTNEHLKIAQVVAAQASFALHNSQLLGKTRRNAHEMQVISEMLQLLNATPDVHDNFADIAAILRHLTKADQVGLVEMDEAREVATILSLSGADRFENAPGPQIPFTALAIVEPILAGKFHITDDLSEELLHPVEQAFYAAGYRSRVAVPLHVRQTFRGALVLAWQRPAGYQPTDESILRQVAGALSLALERTRLFNESANEARRLATLHDLAHQMTGLLDSRQLCELVARRLISDYGYFNVGVLLLNEASSLLDVMAIEGAYQDRTRIPEMSEPIPLGRGLIGQAAQTGRTQLAQDVTQSTQFYQFTGMRTKSELAIPLLVGQAAVGVVVVDSDKTYAFKERDIPLLKTVADHLAVAVEKARLFEETRRRADDLGAVTDASTALREARAVADVIHTVLDRAGQMLGATTSTIFIVDEETNVLQPLGSVPQNGLARPGHVGQGLSGQVFQRGEALIIEDLNESTFAALLAEETAQLSGAQSAIALPLHTGERTIGVLFIGFSEPHLIGSSERRLAATLAELAGNAIDRALILETLEQRVELRTAELARANLQLQELDRLKTKFVSDVSHELRTPITSLSLYIDLLRRAGPERQTHYLDILRQQINRLSTLIEDVLSLSRLDKAQDKIEVGPVDLNSIVQQVVKAHDTQLGATGISLNLTLRPDLPAIDGDQNQLAQVVTHLFANALHFTEAGAISLQTDYRPESQRVCLKVTDTGVGIPADDIPHLFDRFFRGSNTADITVPGGGLGLAIVKEIVALHRGSIEVESEPGHGSAFTVWLPIDPLSHKH